MYRLKKCGDGLLLRTGTLILLWVVVIGSGLYMWGVNFKHNRPLTNDNNTCIYGKDIAVDYNHYTTSVESNNVDIHNKTQNATIQADNSSKNSLNGTQQTALNSGNSTSNNDSLTFKNSADNFGHEIQNATDPVDNSSESSANETQQTTAYDSSSTPGNDFLSVKNDKNTANQKDNANQNSVNETKEVDENGTSVLKNDTSDVENAIENDEQRICVDVPSIRTIRKTLIPYIHYYFLAWSIFALSSSILGIYGVHKSVAKLLTFGVLFFYLSVVTLILIMLEINIDSNIEYRMTVLGEFTGVAWNKRAFEDTKMLINTGLLVLTALSLGFAIMVNRCRRNMIKNRLIKVIRADNEDFDFETSIPLKRDVTSNWPNMYAPPLYPEEA